MKLKILWIIAVLWMTLIFSFSAQPASESGKLSMTVSRVILEISKKFNALDADAQNELIKENDEFIRKAAHMFLYFVLGVIMGLVFRQYKLTSAQAFFAAVIFCALYAAADEVHQLFSPGRACQVSDMAIDTAAALAGCGALWLIMWCRQKIKFIKLKG